MYTDFQFDEEVPQVTSQIMSLLKSNKQALGNEKPIQAASGKPRLNRISSEEEYLKDEQNLTMQNNINQLVQIIKDEDANNYDLMVRKLGGVIDGDQYTFPGLGILGKGKKQVNPVRSQASKEGAKKNKWIAFLHKYKNTYKEMYGEHTGVGYKQLFKMASVAYHALNKDINKLDDTGLGDDTFPTPKEALRMY
jgi:hypothetical protein